MYRPSNHSIPITCWPATAGPGGPSGRGAGFTDSYEDEGFAEAMERFILAPVGAQVE